MRKKTLAVAAAAVAAVAATAGVAAFAGSDPQGATASSHREAPLISEDPTADNTDVYAFRSPDKPDTVTIIANYLPAEDTAAGPIYYAFSPTARYNIKIDRNGDALPDVTYRFQFNRQPGQFFLGNTVQNYTVTRIQGSTSTVVARGTTPPNNIGPRSTPNYRQLAQGRVFALDGGGSVFAGQREDPFYADIGAIFDLLAFRRGTGNTGGGKDFFAGYAVHSIALQLPIAQLTDADSTIGVWATAERPRVTVRNVLANQRVRIKVGTRTFTRTVRVRRAVARTSFVQVSRLANPLVNELIIPTTRKDEWNRGTPDQEAKFEGFYRTPILAAVINQLYPGVINAPETGRDDLVSVLLTGVPGLNNTGAKLADLLRLNMSIAPRGPVGTGNRLGVFGGDNAGYPNGRRLEDDAIDIAERAVAGKLKGNTRADLLGDGVDANDVPFLSFFPYMPDPSSGFDNVKGQQKP